MTFIDKLPRVLAFTSVVERSFILIYSEGPKLGFCLGPLYLKIKKIPGGLFDLEVQMLSLHLIIISCG